MITTAKIFTGWLALIALTLCSVFVGEVVEPKALFLLLVLAIVTAKGQQIVDIFMELKYAPRFWRRLLLSYILIVPLIILVIYLL